MAVDKSNPAIILRKEAKDKGLTRYFTGIPCHGGHIAERYVSTYQCCICLLSHGSKWWRSHGGKLKEKKRRYYQRHKAEIGERQKSPKVRNTRNENFRKWYTANRDRLNEKQRWLYAQDPEKRRVHNRNYFARRNGNGGTHTDEDIIALLKEQRGKCAYCGRKVGKSYNVDHIIPLSRGGSNARRNLQILCPSCNFRKHDHDPIDHARTLGLLL